MSYAPQPGRPKEALPIEPKAPRVIAPQSNGFAKNAAASGASGRPGSSREIQLLAKVPDFTPFDFRELKCIEKNMSAIVGHIQAFRTTIDRECYHPLKKLLETAPPGEIRTDEALTLIDVRIKTRRAYDQLSQRLDVYNRIFEEPLVGTYIHDVFTILEPVVPAIRTAEMSEDPSWREPLLEMRDRLATVYQGEPGDAFYMYSECLGQVMAEILSRLLRNSSLPPLDLLASTEWYQGGDTHEKSNHNKSTKEAQ